jgi:hypothetical protein
MSQFTSFVAVEEMTVTDGGEPRRIEVPVEMPEGLSQDGIFGKGDQPFEKLQLLADLQRAPLARKAPGGGGGGGDRTTGMAASKGELPKISLKAGPPPASSQPKARAGKDSSTGSAGGIGRGSGGGMGAGDGRGVARGTSSNMGGGGVPSPPSPEEQKRREILSKVNPSIAAVIDRLKNKTERPTPNEAKFVRNGKAEIQIWLTDKSSETIAQLKQLGFEVVLEPKSATMVIGRLAIEKLAALVELKSVRYIAPIMSN